MNGEDLLQQLSDLSPELVMECSDIGRETETVPEYRRKPSKRGKAVIGSLVAAALILTACTYGAGQLDLDVALANHIGIKTEESAKLGGGLVEINESRTIAAVNGLTGETEDVTLTVTESVGDKNNAYIKVETNIKLPEGCTQNSDDENPDYVTFNSISVNPEMGHGSDSNFRYANVLVDEDGYVYMIVGINQEHINKRKVDLSFQDLVYVNGRNGNGDPIINTVYSGVWNFSWKYCYTSDTIKIRKNETITYHGLDYQIKTIELTPLGIILSGNCSGDPGDDLLVIESVSIGDTTYPIENWGFSKNVKDSVFGKNEFTSTCSIEGSGTLIDMKEISKITVGGVEIEL